MFRKLLLTAVLGFGSLTGLALTPSTADAHSPIERRHERHHRFEVFYLDCGHWKSYGTYRERCDEIARQGYEGFLLTPLTENAAAAE